MDIMVPMKPQAKKRLSKKGFTIAEVLLAVAILAFALCGILATYLACFNLSGISKNMNIATSCAQGVIEQLRAKPFTQVTPGMVFLVNGVNYSSSLVSSNIYCWKFTVPTSSMPPDNKMAVYIDFSDGDLLKVTVSVCWKQAGKIIGEDTDLNGILDPGEDANGNGLIDSPVELITLVSSR
ncbi:MAG: prepilin-type N-terminal cleavage/methylation domain-containing protein [Candidatus Omnitrophota bacterium]